MADRTGRVGLRRRLSVAVAGVVLASVAVITAGTLLGVRATLMTDFEARAADQFVVNARLVAGALRSQEAEETVILASLRPPVRSRPLLWSDDSWYAASLQAQRADVPESLHREVVGGSPRQQIIDTGSGRALVLGVPLGGQTAYFEVFALDSVVTSLTALARTLGVVGLAATSMGAVTGSLVAKRLLRPVEQVADIAERIAGGALDARMTETLDPDLSRLASSFNRMADALAERIAREARFASDVSHELRSPLTTLATGVAVLEGRSSELSSEGREALGLISADVARLQRTIADLLEIARHDAGAVELDLDSMPVGEAVRVVARRVGVDPGVVGVEPSVVGATAAVDLRRLERIVANLVANAETHGGGIHALVVTADDRNARIAVEDLGPGIPPEEHGVVFDRFARGVLARRRGSTDGSGLGLALVAENARMLGGRAYVDPSYRTGTRIVFELPLETS